MERKGIRSAVPLAWHSNPGVRGATLPSYASRNHVENHLCEQFTFFHLDYSSCNVRLDVDFDLTLTVLAERLYRKLAERLKCFA